MTRVRALSTVAGAAVLGGALLMLVALIEVPGPWLRGYVSEAGTTGQPLAIAYRCGLVLLAFGVGTLGLALRRLLPPAAFLLTTAAVLAGTSGVVPCTENCPLPPFEPTTTADVVHTLASIAGMAVLAGAMLLVVISRLRPAVRRVAMVAAALTVPLAGWLGLTMLLVGRGELGATLERILLVVAVCWLIGTSVVLSWPARITVPV